MLIEDLVQELRCEVAGSAARSPHSLTLARTLVLHVAVLDMNLDGVLFYQVAEVLRSRGVPFLFATGYAAVSVPAEFQDAPVLAKPFGRE